MPAAAKTFREHERDWDAKATQSAIDSARAVIGSDGINGRSMISSLSDIEWGWIVSAAIFAWIKTKAEQAVAESLGYDTAIRTMTGRDPQPWEAGALGTILPSLGSVSNIDWGRPVGEWSKDQIISFAWQIYKLADGALAARDEGATDKIVKRISQPMMEREASAMSGGPLMSRDELSDDIPF